MDVPCFFESTVYGQTLYRCNRERNRHNIYLLVHESADFLKESTQEILSWGTDKDVGLKYKNVVTQKFHIIFFFSLPNTVLVKLPSGEVKRSISKEHLEVSKVSKPTTSGASVVQKKPDKKEVRFIFPTSSPTTASPMWSCGNERKSHLIFVYISYI